MVRIRLRRQGAKKKPTYRVVVADSRSPRDGRFIESIGFYDPRANPPTMSIDEERASYWLGVGAQPSDAVLRILKKKGIWQEFKGIPVEPVSEAESLEAAADDESDIAAAAEAETEAEDAADDAA